MLIDKFDMRIFSINTVHKNYFFNFINIYHASINQYYLSKIFFIPQMHTTNKLI